MSFDLPKTLDSYLTYFWKFHKMTFAEKWAFRAFFNSLLNKLGKNRFLIHSCLFSHFKENFDILDIQYQNLGNTCCPKIQKIFSCPKVAPLQISCHYHHWIQKKSIPKVSRLENAFWNSYVQMLHIERAPMCARVRAWLCL